MAQILTSKNELIVTAPGDQVHVVDVSDTTDNPAGSSRRVKLENLLPSVLSEPGSFGGASSIPTLTVNAKGQITNISQASIVLPDSGVTAGTYGSATRVPQIAIDAKGRVTSASEIAFNSGGVYLASSAGAYTGTDDTTVLQAGINAAIAQGLPYMLDGPPGTSWVTNATLTDSLGSLQAPRATSVDTSTGVITFDRIHRLRTGDVIAMIGPDIGSGGGMTQVKGYTEYFVNVVSTTTIRLYNTRTNANNGTSTGLYLPSSGITTTGVMNTVSITQNMSAVAANQSGSVTVADASKIIEGDYINFGGTNSTSYGFVTNINANVITFTAFNAVSAITAPATRFVSSVDVANVLTLEVGSTFTFGNPVSINSSYTVPTVTAINGTTVHYNWPMNSSLPTSGATQDITLGWWIDPRYLSLKLKILCAPGVSIRKKSTFAGTSIFQFAYGTHIEYDGVELWGLSAGLQLYPSIINGDDGIRSVGCAGLTIRNCIFRNFGDSAYRLTTGTSYPGARSTSHPSAGIAQGHTIIDGNYFFDCFQMSTTNSNDAFRGGVRDVIFTNNICENIGASVKFANRVTGSENFIITGNIFRNVGRNGLELDSIDNYVIDGNTFLNCAAYGVSLIANDLIRPGFAFHNARITNNLIKGGALTASGGGGILVRLDSYPDSTIWDYKGLIISGNEIYDLPVNTIPINLSSGLCTGVRIENNTLDGNAGVNMLRIVPRNSVTAGFKNNILIKGNVFRRCIGTKTTAILITPSNGAAGGPYTRGIDVIGNHFDTNDTSLGISGSNDSRFVHVDYVQDLRMLDNWWEGPGFNALYCQTEGKDITVTGNVFRNTNTAAGNIINVLGVDGFFVTNNRIYNANSGAWFNVDRKCQRVHLFGSDVVDSVSKTISVGNVPIKTSADRSRREDYVAAAPTTGTWDAGDRYWITAPGTGTTLGGVCTVGGTFNSPAITATSDSTNGSAILTPSAMTNLAVGMYLTHAGFSGTRKIISMTATTITLDANATSDQTAQSIAVSTPTFKAMPNIA